jgi:hypothetical protein
MMFLIYLITILFFVCLKFYVMEVYIKKPKCPVDTLPERVKFELQRSGKLVSFYVLYLSFLSITLSWLYSTFPIPYGWAVSIILFISLNYLVNKLNKRQ